MTTDMAKRISFFKLIAILIASFVLFLLFVTFGASVVDPIGNFFYEKPTLDHISCDVDNDCTLKDVRLYPFNELTGNLAISDSCPELQCVNSKWKKFFWSGLFEVKKAYAFCEVGGASCLCSKGVCEKFWPN